MILFHGTAWTVRVGKCGESGKISLPFRFT